MEILKILIIFIPVYCTLAALDLVFFWTDSLSDVTYEEALKSHNEILTLLAMGLTIIIIWKLRKRSANNEEQKNN